MDRDKLIERDREPWEPRAGTPNLVLRDCGRLPGRSDV